MNEYSFSDNKIAVLKQRLNKIKCDASKGSDISRPDVAPQGTHELSYEQKRLWYSCQLFPDSPFYNLSTFACINGGIRPDFLNKALEVLARRHKILMTHFKLIGDLPYQEIDTNNIPQLTHNIIETLSSNKKIKFIEKAKYSASRIKFDLEKGPLWYVELITLSENQHKLLLTFHHIIIDAWSLKIFSDELGHIYTFLSSDREIILPELKLHYFEYSAQQNALWPDKIRSEQGTLEKLSAKLDDYSSLIDLPYDFSRQDDKQPEGKIYSTSCFLKKTSIAGICKTYSASIFNILTAIFSILVYRFSNQNKFIFGIANANRDELKTQNLIGFFINPIILPFDFTEDMCLIDVIKHVNSWYVGNEFVNKIPFDLLVSLLKPNRQINLHPLFQIILDYQYASDYSITLANTNSFLEYNYNNTAKFDISLTFIEIDDGIKLEVEYNTLLFYEKTIKQLIESYFTLLENALINPQKRITAHRLLSEKKAYSILTTLNQTQTRLPSCRNLVCLFNQAVKTSPHSTALTLGNEELSYFSVQQQYYKLTSILKSYDIKKNNKIILCCDLTCELVIGILSILHLGAIYVPIDPYTTSVRINSIIADTQPQLILTTIKYVKLFSQSSFPIYAFKYPIILENDAGIFLPKPVKLKPNDPIYIIYTSGTSGKPKGVVNIHEGALNHIFWAVKLLKDTQPHILCIKTSISFDASFMEIMYPLVTGSKLVFPSKFKLFDPYQLKELIIKYRVTIIILTPSQLSILLSLFDQKFVRQSFLKHIICGGEVLTKQLALRFLSVFGSQINLHNLYGLTEASDDSVHRLLQFSDTKRAKIPIGTPISNIQCFILDSLQYPVPPGAIGELYIGGLGLALEYLNNVKLTRERFVPNLFCNLDANFSKRLCRTGDLVRYDTEYQIYYYGRSDSQVKLRGIRLELEEIEFFIKKNSNVIDAAVAIYNQRMYAFIVTRKKITKLSVREHISHYDYSNIIPEVIIFCKSIPKLLSGKVNRKLLLDKCNISLMPEKPKKYSIIDPENETEEKLLEIWKKVLIIKSSLCINSNFFEIGGNSLLAARVIIAINNIFHLKLPLSALIRNPTIRLLARQISEKGHKPLSIIVPLAYNARTITSSFCHKLNLFLVHPLGGNVFCYQLLASLLNDILKEFKVDIITYGIESPFVNSPDIEINNFDELINFYLENIFAVQRSGPYYIGGWSFGGLVATALMNRVESTYPKTSNDNLLVIIDADAHNNNIKFLAKLHDDDIALLNEYVKYFNIHLPEDEADISQKLLNLIYTGDAGNRPDLQQTEQRIIFAIKSHIKLLADFRLPNIYSKMLVLLAQQRVLKNHSNWKSVAVNESTVHEIPGTHWSMLEEKNVNQIAQIIAQEIIVKLNLDNF